MSEQKESSVLFSLKELMTLEEDRIRGEEAEKAAASAAAEKARADAERAAREAEEARIRAENERRRVEEQRTREESARVDGIRVAEIEKARVEAEQRARLEAMAVQQQHERSLAAIKEDDHKKKLRRMLFVGGAAVVIVGLLGGIFWYRGSEEARARAAADTAEKARLEDEQQKLKASLAEQSKKVDSLLTQLAGANDEATRLRLQKELQEAQRATESMKTGRGGGARPAAGAGAAGKPKGKCAPGDPLCTDL